MNQIFDIITGNDDDGNDSAAPTHCPLPQADPFMR